MFLFLLESFPMPEAPTAPTCYREQFVTNEAEAGVVMIAAGSDVRWRATDLCSVEGSPSFINTQCFLTGLLQPQSLIDGTYQCVPTN